MSVVLPVDLDARPFHRVLGDLLAAPLFATGLPMRGPAAWLDWRMCGLVARTLGAGQLEATPGRALLVPTLGRLRVGWLLLSGAGDPAAFGEPALRAWTEDTFVRAADLRVATVALSLPPERLARLPLERAIAAALAGAAAALCVRPSPLRLRIVVTPAELTRAEKALAAAPRSYPGGVVLRVERALADDDTGLQPGGRPEGGAPLRPSASPG